MTEKNIYSVISEKIKEARLKAGFTQQQVADKVNIADKFISGIERNVDKPSLDTFVKIAQALNVSLDSLIKDTRENKIKEKKQISKNLLQIEYLFSDLSDKQQKQIITLIKYTKKLIKNSKNKK